MPDSTLHAESDAGESSQSSDGRLMGSAEYFEAERRDEARKRLASYSLWAGLIGILLLLIPNPIPWLAGPLAVLLGILALICIRLRPERCGGTGRAVVGILLGVVSMVACRWWLA